MVRKKRDIKHSVRNYKFDLPYKLTAMYLFYGLQQMKNDGIFKKLPGDIQSKMQKSSDEWRDVRITKNDLDRIDDTTLKEISDMLTKYGVSFEYEIVT